MKIKVTKNNYPKLIKKLQTMKNKLPIAGEQWAETSARYLEQVYRSHLETQGREGGEPPPLSDATHHLYDQLGNPDGSGIRNHISVQIECKGLNTVAVMGIKKGDPTMIAKVQDRGCTIEVTDAMRGFLAAHGIYLRGDTTHIIIPARHSWSKSVAKASEEAKKKLKTFWIELNRAK